MTSQRVADAARISPYPFVVHQVPSTPPENGDLSRPAKGKKKPKPRVERTNQQEEESRFNIGPVRPGGYGIRRNSRQAGRSHVDDRSRIPDYPPPSFQEATSGLSPSPSTISLSPATVSVSTVSIPDDLPEQPAQEPTTTKVRKEIDPIKEEEDASDSDECVIVNKNEIPISSADLPPAKREERVKMDWLKRRRPELPGVSTSNVKVDEYPRGRKTSRPTLRINPDFDATEPTPPELPISSPKRRFLSLSPIRTIFPIRTAGQQDRSSISANPSPILPKSPLISSRNFLRSTNSLAPLSVVKLPGSSPPTGLKKESLSRRLFSHKGKERSKDPVVLENLEDNWEVVETTIEAESHHPQSLLSAIESLSLNGSTATLLSKCSPTTKQVQHNSSGGKAMDENASASSLKDVIGSSSPSSSAEDESHPDNQGSTIGMTSLPQNEILESPPTSPTLVANTPTSSTPPIRSLNLPIDSQPPLVHTVSPPPVMTQPILTSDHHAAVKDVFQRALEIPLPMTPVSQNRTEHGSSRGVEGLKEGLLPPLVPVAVWRSPGAARSTPDFLQERYRTVSPGPVPNCSCGVRTTPIKYIPSPLSISVFPNYQTGTPATHRFVSAKMPSAEEPSTPSKHHYSGRPLPRPPSNSDFPRTDLNPVLSLKDGRVSSASLAGSQAEPQDGRGMEGLLIDLEDTSLDTNTLSPTTTMTTGSDESRYQSQAYLPLVSNTPSSVEFAHEPSATPMELMDLSFASSSIQATSTMIAPASAGPTHLPSCSHHRHHQQIQCHQTSPHQLAGFLKSNNLDLPVRYCDGLHSELHSHHHPRLQEGANVRQCWSCQPPSLWRTPPDPAALPVPHGVYQPQHYHQHLPMDNTQRHRHHITHLSY